MTLKKREKILAIAITALLVVFAVYMVWPSGEDSLDALRNKRADLEKKKDDNLKQAVLLKKDTNRLPALLRRSLPSNTETAKREYQNWLLKLADNKLQNVNLVATDPQPLAHVDDADSSKSSRIIYKFHFTITCQGTLDELTRFLFDFYSAGHLQKICSINITPQKNPQLDLVIVVEALSLPGSKQTDQLSTEKGNRLKLASANEYNKVIVKRNPFVAYTPPKNERPKGEPAPPAKINPLEFSFLTGIMEANGVLEALIHERTTDETLYLHEGEEFTIGKVKGKVNRIGYDDIDIEIDGKTHTVSLGNSLKL
ncbi:MAG: hypothetical protein ABSE63_14375 [Thermoguttaceae bacterium]|jgi:Tfp pilus assembly protein PilP